MINISRDLKPNNQAGFTLVELMVGLVIGLIASIVIMQVFSTFEGQKRTTTGSANAQTNGSIGLYNIQREVQMAGFGLPIFDGDPANPGTGNNTVLNCPATTTVDHDNNAATAEIDIFPVAISNGAAGASDTITARYGDAPNGGIPTTVRLVASPTLGVDNTLGCQNNDVALFVRGNICASARVNDADLDAVTNQITLNRTTDLTGAINMTVDGKLSCLGQYNQVVFAVNANNELTRTDNTGVTSPIISDIVNIQAQYGVSATNNSNQVTQWVDTVTPATRNRVRAIRVAIVAQNNLLERNVVTPVAPQSWAGGPAINLTANADWNRYRYRVYETIIPVRNITFSGALL